MTLDARMSDSSTDIAMRRPHPRSNQRCFTRQLLNQSF
jgi:hypothetical protein